MGTAQIIALMAAFLSMFGPAAQFIHVWRSKSTRGLSLSTFTILNLSLMCSLLLGIQYRIGPGLIFAFMAWAVKLAVLGQISLRAALTLLGIAAAVAAAVLIGPPIVAQLVITTQFSEFVAFTWGLLLAIAFLPQVWMSHRTRNTRNLSFVGLVISAAGTGLWTVFAVMVRNYAMIFWCSVMLISLLELIRLWLAMRMAPPEVTAAPGAGST